MNGIPVTTNKYVEFTNYFIVCLLIGASGSPYFYTSNIMMVIISIFTTLVFLKRGIYFDTRALTIMAPFFIVEILQVVFIKQFVLGSMLVMYFKLFLAFFAVSLCGGKFTRYYSNIMFWIVIISFIFYVPAALSHSFFSLFYDRICAYFPAPFSGPANDYYETLPTIIVFTFHPVIQEMFRNPGPFWEPGAFVIFIIIAIIIDIIEEKHFWSKRNIVFIIGIVTTLSTTGYVAFFLLLMFYNFVTGNIIKNFFVLVIAIPVGVGLFYNLDFMHKKFQGEMNEEGDTTTRLGSGMADFEDFINSPIIGWGRGEMRYGGRKFTFFSREQHRNNGLLSLMATYGIVVTGSLLYNYYKSYRKMCVANSYFPIFAYVAFFITILMSLGETIFQYPFFLSLMFIHLVYTKDQTVAM